MRTVPRVVVSMLLVAWLASAAWAVPGEVELPRYVGYVNDFANLLPPTVERQLVALITEVERRTTAEMAIVTIESTDPLDIERYAVELYEKWGIGKKGEDNGVLVLIAVKDRKAKIEVGYGLEGALPDGLCGEILRTVMIPNFKAGRFSEGITGAAYRIAGIIGKEYNVEIPYVGEPTARYVPGAAGRRAASPLRSLMTLLFFSFWAWPFLFFRLTTGSWRRRRMYPGGWHVGRGGFGGGFSGFGGGLSGGGGATGSW